MTQHSRKPQAGPYRARDGVILGVCKGLARHLDCSPFWLRMIALVLLFTTGVGPAVVLYVLAAVLMKPEPLVPFDSEEEEEFYTSYTASRRMALQRLKRVYDRLDARIRRMESVVTARDYDWERRFDGGTSSP